jgi:hypothetical protein
MPVEKESGLYGAWQPQSSPKAHSRGKGGLFSVSAPSCIDAGYQKRTM